MDEETKNRLQKQIDKIHKNKPYTTNIQKIFNRELEHQTNLVKKEVIEKEIRFLKGRIVELYNEKKRLEHNEYFEEAERYEYVIDELNTYINRLNLDYHHYLEVD